jgi:hypothetical protein
MTVPLDLLREEYNLNTRRISETFAKLSEAERHFRPYGNINSFVWELGHLTLTRNTLVKLLNPAEKLTILPDEGKLFGFGSQPQVPEAYPNSEELLAAFQSRGARLVELLGSVSAERWEAPSPYPFPNMPPTVVGQVLGLLLHERMHLGEMNVLRNIVVKNREALFGQGV